MNEDENSIEFEDETKQPFNTTEETAVETPTEKAADTASGAEKDSAQEAADPLGAFRREIMMIPGDWYVIHTYSGHERKVKANLERRVASQNVEEKTSRVEVSSEYTNEFGGLAKKRVHRIRIPGYVVVYMDFDDDFYHVVKDTPAVAGFVGDQHSLVPLSIDEAVDLLRFSILEEVGLQAVPAAAVKEEVRVAFETDEVVSIVEGPFEGMETTISQILSEAQELKVLVMIFECKTELEFAFKQVTRREE